MSECRPEGARDPLPPARLQPLPHLGRGQGLREQVALGGVAPLAGKEAQLGLCGPAVSDLIVGIFRDLGAPPASIRYRDFGLVRESYSPSSATLLVWLERLGLLSSGLVVPAWLAWSAYISESDLPVFMDLLRNLAEVQQPLRPLSQQELDLVQTPPPEVLDAVVREFAAT